MKYVLTEDGNIKIKDGHPLVVEDDGAEHTVDAIGAQEKITALNGEAANRRTENKQLKLDLAKFSEIEDPTKAIEALKTVESLSDDHKLEIETLKVGLKTSYDTIVTEKETLIAGLEDKLFDATVMSKFSTSKVVEGLTLTPDIAASFFGKNFSKDGSAKDSAGNVIFSKTKPGEPADFEEALSMIVDSYPLKDSILKSKVSGGGDGHNGNNNDGSDDSEKTATENIAAGLAARNA